MWKRSAQDERLNTLGAAVIEVEQETSKYKDVKAWQLF